MKRIEKNIILEKEIDRKIPNNSVFLDIETTGLSRSRNRIYLIGFLKKINNKSTFIQLMTQKQYEERDLLIQTIEILKDVQNIITFNGESFDLGFIKKRCDRFNMDFTFENYNSIDLFKKIKNSSFLLNLENYKLKTLEKNIGIYREDMFSGGDLIALYFEYEASNDDKLEKVLLLHNEEDILNLPNLLKYGDILREKNSFEISDFDFLVEKINVNKSIFSVSGVSNIERAYFDNGETALTIEDKLFNFEGNVKVGKYDDNTNCVYVEKNGLLIKNQYEIKCPDEIVILKHSRNILYKNVFEFTKIYLKNMLGGK